MYQALDLLMELDNFTATWTGAFTTGQSGNFYYTRIGNCVFLSIEGINAAQDASSTVTIPASTLPSSIRPDLEYHQNLVDITDNLISKTGSIIVKTDGSLELSLPGGDSFSGSTNLSWNNFCVNYPVKRVV